MKAVAVETSAPQERSWQRALSMLSQGRIWVVLVVIVILAAIESHGDFVHPSNIVNLLFNATPIGLAALGETVVILTAGIDLSVAGTSILAAVVAGSFANHGLNPWVALAAGLAVGLLVGAANGVVVAWIKMPALIATLGMLLVTEGLARTLTANAPILSLVAGYRALGTASMGGVPVVTVLWVVLSCVLALVLWRTVWGKSIYALGSNQRAAFISGFRVRQSTFTAYCIAGVLAALSGCLQSGYLNIATPNVDYTQLFEVIAGAVVGGTSLFGGEGNVISTVGGVLVIMAIQNLLLLMGVSAQVMQGVVGFIIVAAVFLNIRLKRESSRVEHKGI